MISHPLASAFRISNRGNVPALWSWIECTSVVFDNRVGDDGPLLGDGAPSTTHARTPFDELSPGDGFEVACDPSRAQQYWSADFVDVRFDVYYEYDKWWLPGGWWRTTVAPSHFRFQTSRDVKTGKYGWTQIASNYEPPPIQPVMPHISETEINRPTAGRVRFRRAERCTDLPPRFPQLKQLRPYCSPLRAARL